MRLNYNFNLLRILIFLLLMQATAWSKYTVKNIQLIPLISGQPICEQVRPPWPTSQKDQSPFKTIDKIKIALSKEMKKQFPENPDAFPLESLVSYKTYPTKCGNFYSINAQDYSNTEAHGFCGSGGCDFFFFKQTANGLKLVFHRYLEAVEFKPVDLNSNDKNCLVLKVWVHGTESKNMQRAGQNWLSGLIQFKRSKVKLILNDP